MLSPRVMVVRGGGLINKMSTGNREGLMSLWSDPEISLYE